MKAKLTTAQKRFRCAMMLSEMWEAMEVLTSLPLSCFVYFAGDEVKVSPVLAPYADSVFRYNIRDVQKCLRNIPADSYVRQQLQHEATVATVSLLTRIAARKNAYKKVSDILGEGDYEA